MKKNAPILTIVAFLSISANIYVTNAIKGVDIAWGYQLSVEDYKCLIKEGYEFAIFRAYRKVGVIDFDAKENIKNAWAAGMKRVDLYIYPCLKECDTDFLSISPRQQIRDMMNYLEGVNFGDVYLDIEGGWWYNAFYDQVEKNQAFVRDMVDEILRYGHTPGFYSNWNYWLSLLGGDDFTEMSKYPIWYCAWDKEDNFDNWQNFGGWTAPNMKQYQGLSSETTVCKHEFDLDYRKSI